MKTKGLTLAVAFGALCLGGVIPTVAVALRVHGNVHSLSSGSYYESCPGGVTVPENYSEGTYSEAPCPSTTTTNKKDKSDTNKDVSGFLDQRVNKIIADFERTLVKGSVELTDSEDAAGVLTEDFYATIGGGAHAKKILIASGKTTFKHSGKDKLKLKLTAAGKRLLKGGAKLLETGKERFKLTVSATFKPKSKSLKTIKVSKSKKFKL